MVIGWKVGTALTVVSAAWFFHVNLFCAKIMIQVHGFQGQWCIDWLAPQTSVHCRYSPPALTLKINLCKTGEESEHTHSNYSYTCAPGTHEKIHCPPAIWKAGNLVCRTWSKATCSCVCFQCKHESRSFSDVPPPLWTWTSQISSWNPALDDFSTTISEPGSVHSPILCYRSILSNTFTMID